MFEMFLKIILDLTSLFEDDKLHIPLRLQYCIINMLQRILNGISEMVVKNYKPISNMERALVCKILLYRIALD